jgi:hypothetical protein
LAIFDANVPEITKFHRPGGFEKAQPRPSQVKIRQARLEWRKSGWAANSKGSIRLNLSSIRPSIGTKNPIPEEMDHREIAVRVPVMNEMQLLFPSEPCKSLKPRSLYVVFLVEKDVRVERRRTRD